MVVVDGDVDPNGCEVGPCCLRTCYGAESCTAEIGVSSYWRDSNECESGTLMRGGGVQSPRFFEAWHQTDWGVDEFSQMNVA